MTDQSTRKTIKHIHEGHWAADVEITLHYDLPGWDATIDLPDVKKLDRVRRALRAGDVKTAAKEATVFELHPVAAE